MTDKILIFLDDERSLKDVTWITYPEYKLVRTFRTHSQFTNYCDNVFGGYISKENFNNIDFSFDHDLQSFDRYGKEWTGYDCIKYLLETTVMLGLHNGCGEYGDIENSSIIVHSKNPIGKENIEKYLLNYKKHTRLSDVTLSN